jgi:hypothetical protein
LPDSANVFNDSPIEEPMAIAQTPLESDLRDPRGGRRELGSLLWLCGWGGLTAVALIILAITTQTEAANERLRRTFAINDSSAIARMPPRVSQLESETQLLAAQVRALIVERDRLAGRIALLESSIDDLTGTVKKQAAAQAAATTAALTAKATPPAAGGPAATPSVPSNPVAGSVTTATITGSIAAAAPPPKADTATTQSLPLPQARVAAAPAADADSLPTKQSEFGLDLGGGATVDNIRQRWTTVKANFGPLLSGMYPLAVRDPRPASTGYRLVVGPLPNSVAAAGLCTHFTAARTACKAVKFDGEQVTQP